MRRATFALSLLLACGPGGDATTDSAAAEARINQLYPGRLRTTPHKYTAGHYLTVRPAGVDSANRLVFETDGQRVTRYRGGRLPEVEWVEGCS